MIRFTTRELFLLTTIAAIGLAWMVDRWQLTSRFEGSADQWNQMGLLRIETQVHRDIAHTMESQANDCWTSLKWERKQNEELRQQLADSQAGTPESVVPNSE